MDTSGTEYLSYIFKLVPTPVSYGLRPILTNNVNNSTKNLVIKIKGPLQSTVVPFRVLKLVIKCPKVVLRSVCLALGT